MDRSLLPSCMEQVLSAYSFPCAPAAVVPYGNGHINDTYCVLCQPRNGDCIRYILQRLSAAAFPQPRLVMENMVALTEYLSRIIEAEGGDISRETLRLIPTRDGRAFYSDPDGRVWRLTMFIEQTDCYDRATEALFEASAYAFGSFQRRLRDFPIGQLHTVIADFHNTPVRFEHFLRALAEDPLNRAAQVKDQISFVLSREQDCSVAQKAQAAGQLPLRVTHNDTKLNNVLIDRKTARGLCVIDLDTTMSGLSIDDFGDSIRFGANHCAEDEHDLSNVNFDLPLFECYTRGFLLGAQGTLLPAELDHLPWGARRMTLECGIRFLTDYLLGDTYFRTHYPHQNLYRCRTQFKLVEDMEQNFEKMLSIVNHYR